MTDTPTGNCHTCGNPFEGHEVFKHPFNDGSVPLSATFGPRRSDGSRGRPEAAQRASQGHQPPAPADAMAPWPFDPVLRQALINKGILTPEDLRDAENQIRAVTAAFGEGVKDGQ